MLFLGRPHVDTGRSRACKNCRKPRKNQLHSRPRQLIDNIVNDVAHSFGLLESAVYLHDESNGEMVMGGVHGCTIHSKGFRLKSRQRRHGRLRRLYRPDALRP
jgi:hypothetical protein